MAIIHFINTPKSQNAAGLSFVLNYTMQDKKTVSNGKKYVSGINCTPSSAYTEFRNTKHLYGKEDGRQYYHFVQSFPAGEWIDPATAHEIALRFASESEKLKGFEIVVSTHCDRDHIHSHFVMNSVNADTGKKFHIAENEVEMLMKGSDAIIQQYGFSVLSSQSKKQKTKPMSDREYRSADKGQSWKLRLAIAIDEAMQLARSKEHFISLMEAEGYAVKWTDERKYITYTTPDGFRCRDNKLHEEKYLKGNMEHEFRIRKEILEGIERANQAADAGGFESRTVRGGYGTELESDDRFAGYAARTADSDPGRDGGAGYEKGNGRVSQSADGTVEEVFRGEQDDHRAIPDGDDEDLGASRYADQHSGEGDGDTGWEHERNLFGQAFYGARGDENVYAETVSDLDDPCGDFAALGADAAYLVAHLTNVLDNAHPVKDSTTMRRPHGQKKKKEQNHGPVMGGM